MKIIAMPCRDYAPETVKINLEAALEALGGISEWLKPGEKVLLKANLLTGKDPSEAVTTHPQVVHALAELLMEAGATVIIADSPAGPFLSSRMKKIYRLTGMERVAEETGASLNWNMESEEIHFGKGYRLKDFPVMKALHEVDHVISLCKMKTHSMTLMTGAVKNMFGVMPGLKKAELHFRFTDPEQFGHALVDICEYARPVLSVMDGVEAMEGAGPSAGSVKKSGVLLVSRNPHDLDVAAAKLMGINPENVPTIRAAQERNLCHFSPDDMDLGMETAEDRQAFKLPDTKDPDFLERYAEWPLIGPFLRQISRRHLRPKPVLQAENCIGCAECHIICPADAIRMEEHQPVFEYEKCIRCYCCQEICPEKAIWIYRPKILRRLDGNK